MYLYQNVRMNDRSGALLAIRPTISKAIITANMSADEHFQNETLRPIIKLQNPLLLAVFQQYIVKRKNVFHTLKSEKRLLYISHALQKDLKLRNSIKGMVIGQFTANEYRSYIAHSSALNKRMMQMIIKRLQDQIQFFEPQLTS